MQSTVDIGVGVHVTHSFYSCFWNTVVDKKMCIVWFFIVYLLLTKWFAFSVENPDSATRLRFPVCNCPLSVSLCPLQPLVSVLGEEVNVVSAVVDHPPQGSTCRSSRDASLLTTVVIWLSVVFLSAPTCALSSDLSHHQGVSAHRTAARWMFFHLLFFHTILSKNCCVKIPGDQQFLKYSNWPSETNQQSRHSQSH